MNKNKIPVCSPEMGDKKVEHEQHIPLGAFPKEKCGTLIAIDPAILPPLQE